MFLRVSLRIAFLVFYLGITLYIRDISLVIVLQVGVQCRKFTSLYNYLPSSIYSIIVLIIYSIHIFFLLHTHLKAHQTILQFLLCLSNAF